MKQIILARHAEKEDEAYDSPLNEHGISQAQEMSQFLRKYQFEVVFTSLLQRSIDTAKIISTNKNISLISNINFNEYYVGSAENIEQTRAGEARAMQKIYSYYDMFASILVIAHSSINQGILRRITNMDYLQTTTYFQDYGDTLVLRNDHNLGDTNWQIRDQFTPSQ